MQTNCASPSRDCVVDERCALDPVAHSERTTVRLAARIPLRIGHPETTCYPIPAPEIRALERRYWARSPP